MANADQFKDMTCTVKIGKKRAAAEPAATDLESKRQRMSDGSQPENKSPLN